MADYKYTELRQMLLYLGKVILEDVISCEKQYNHFLAYSVVCCLMTDNACAKAFHLLQVYLMNYVVNNFAELYGSSFMT